MRTRRWLDLFWADQSSLLLLTGLSWNNKTKVTTLEVQGCQAFECEQSLGRSPMPAWLRGSFRSIKTPVNVTEPFSCWTVGSAAMWWSHLLTSSWMSDGLPGNFLGVQFIHSRYILCQKVLEGRIWFGRSLLSQAGLELTSPRNHIIAVKCEGLGHYYSGTILDHCHRGCVCTIFPSSLFRLFLIRVPLLVKTWRHKDFQNY